MTVIVKSTTELVVPRSVRRQAGIKTGDRVEFKVSDGVITILPATDDEHTPTQRRAIDRGIAASERDYQAGRSYGPFATHKEFIELLHKEAAKLKGKKTKPARK